MRACSLEQVVQYCDGLDNGACPNAAVAWIDGVPVCPEHRAASTTGSES